MTDTPPSNTPRGRILEAVIACIERDGINALTTRKIAEQAGANIASINYYFRSKEMLVNEALAMTLRHMMDDITVFLDTPEQPFSETLSAVLAYLLEGSLRFPGVIMAHFYPALVEKRFDTPGVLAIRQVFERLVERAAQAFPQHPVERIRSSLYTILSATTFTVLTPGFYQPCAPLDLSQPENLREYACYLAQVFESSAGLAPA